jgi:hypothetical protein
MSQLGVLVLAAILMSLAKPAAAQPECTAPALSQAQVADVIAKARKDQRELPAPFAQTEVVFRRNGCHYIYIEYALPRTPEAQNIFKLNSQGVIVDVEPGMLRCPDRQFSEQELGQIVAKARAARRDLPAAFENTRVRVDRRRCLYLYFEYAVPEKPGQFQVFTIDPLGEVMDFYRSKPY